MYLDYYESEDFYHHQLSMNAGVPTCGDCATNSFALSCSSFLSLSSAPKAQTTVLQNFYRSIKTHFLLFPIYWQNHYGLAREISFANIICLWFVNNFTKGFKVHPWVFPTTLGLYSLIIATDSEVSSHLYLSGNKHALTVKVTMTERCLSW